MDFPTFQDAMFPKCAHSLLCRAQIFGFRSHFIIDSVTRLCYDGCVGVDFSVLFLLLRDICRRERLWPFPTFGRAWIPHQRNDPRHPSGVISFPWVRSLGNLAFCWIGRLLNLVGIPSAAFGSSAYVRVWHLCKTEDGKSRPAGVLTISGITFFRTTRIPFFHGFYKTGFHTNNFRNYGIKQRIRRFSDIKC